MPTQQYPGSATRQPLNYPNAQYNSLSSGGYGISAGVKMGRVPERTTTNFDPKQGGYSGNPYFCRIEFGGRLTVLQGTDNTLFHNDAGHFY